MRRRVKRLPLLQLYAAGFLFGLAGAVWLGRKAQATSPEDLRRLREGLMNGDGTFLFYYILFQRMKWVAFMVIAGTTYLSPAVCALAAAWIGTCLGETLALSVMTYGIKGILLAASLTLPQWLLYLPGAYLLMRWCEELHAMICHEKKLSMGKHAAWLVLILFLIGIGISLESFWSPKRLLGVLADF